MAKRKRAGSAWTSTVTLAMTGASGAAYGLRLLDCLVASGVQVYFILSEAGRTVIAMETGLELPRTADKIQAVLSRRSKAAPDQLRVFELQDWLSPAASGTGGRIPMVICPASGGTIAAVAHGMSSNLIQRAADVALKERRPLIVVPREMPLSEIQLENQLRLARAGAVIMPASPGFYNTPQSIEDLVDFVVSRILDQLGIEHALMPRWGG